MFLKKKLFFLGFLLNIILLCPVDTFAQQKMIMGVGVHPESFDSNIKNLTSLLKYYNVESIRVDYLWDQVEVVKGKYHPVSQKTEQTIFSANNNGIKSLIILAYGNKNYDNTSFLNPKAKPETATSIQAFSNYAAWVANHLKTQAPIFEVWNEWIQQDGVKNKANAVSQQSARDYASLVLKSCYAIKQINPNAKVIAGGISPFDGPQKQWMFQVVKYGVLDCIDGLSLHPYYYPDQNNLNPQPVIDQLKSFQLQISYINHGKQVPFYITEIGVPDIKNAKYSLGDVAGYLNNFMSKASKINYIKGVWWYDFINDGKDENNKEHNFGLLNQDLSPKPAAIIFKNLTSN